MFENTPFANYPQSTREFYNKIFLVSMLNLVAVKHGMFDVHLCETNDIWTWYRFYDLVPELQHKFGLTGTRE